MKTDKLTVSPESQSEALKIANATQRPGQTKEQTKLIAAGIEKGIAQYKKQQKAKSRQTDKARKQALRKKQQEDDLPQQQNEPQNMMQAPAGKGAIMLPWSLLLISWIGFIAYLALA